MYNANNFHCHDANNFAFEGHSWENAGFGGVDEDVLEVSFILNRKSPDVLQIEYHFDKKI